MSESNPLLPMFKGQLEEECKQLSKVHGIEVRGHFLIYWYFMRLHDFTDTEVEEILCDGGGDLGIDAIWVDEDSLVHFYQFKHPETSEKGVAAGEIDKMISGLRLILQNKHDKIANTELKALLQEIGQQVATGYRIHIISSGQGIPHEAALKLTALVEDLRGPSNNLFAWDEQPLSQLQERFYQQSLPAVKDPIHIQLNSAPYMVRSGSADCYLFHVTGELLAELYSVHGEGLLQRNIRVDQRNTATNRSIEATCTGDDSSNFLHFNNGVTFLCGGASHDNFRRVLTLDKAQVVNGGQTIRALFRARQRGLLRSDVVVPARAITSGGDKDFANNVAVNQNNQNQVGTGFLRSNDQRVVQLAHSLVPLGWYLERRKGELRSLSEDEKAAIQQRIGRPLDGRIIRLTQGAQAYTATFYGQPEIAKKNPKKIFLSTEDGGYFELIFSADMTAEKIVIAHEIEAFVEEFIRSFAATRRKVQASNNIRARYEPVLGKNLTDRHSDVIHQVMPQCSLFLCATLFKDLVDLQHKLPTSIPAHLKTSGSDLIREHLTYIVDYAKKNKDKADKSWQVLLRSSTFFNYIIAYITGIRSTEGRPSRKRAKQ